MYTTRTRRGRIAVTVGAALVLVTGPIAGAQAATGQFRYASANGQEFAIDDPANECSQLVDGALQAANDTDAIATLYEDGNCEAAVVGTPLQPGMAQSFDGGPVPHSVKFG
jgi:hypothetical protein